MKTPLLDVNVLIALIDPHHIHHDSAHNWFGRRRLPDWATCPLTQNAAVRIVSNPSYPSVDLGPAAMVDLVDDLCASVDGHRFWADDVSFTDRSVFNRRFIVGPKQVTDVYLLGLAMRHDGVLATFDRSIPIAAVHGGRNHLEVIASVEGRG